MEMQNDKTRLVFIGGAPRSGTTLLQNMLDSHPDIVGGPEFLHLPDIVSLRKKLHASVSRKWIDLFCSHDDVDTNIRQLINNFLLPFAHKHHAKILSEKTPENVLVFSELTELLPEALFIQVIRDPRAIVASLMQVAQKARKKGLKPAPFTNNLETAIAYVNKCFKAGFQAEQRASDRVLTITYENLVQSPIDESKKICVFLGIDWNESMSTPASKKHLGEHAITVNSNELWHNAQSYNSNPNTNSLDKWEKTLTPIQQYLITSAFQKNKSLQQSGYNISVDKLANKPGPAATTGAALLRSGKKIRNAIGRAARSV